MRHVIHQTKNLSENLGELIFHQESVLSILESHNLPPENQTYLSILLDQLSRLSKARKKLLIAHQVKNPLELPVRDLKVYIELWERSDFVAGLLNQVFTD
jgi:hypothetical protein